MKLRRFSILAGSLIAAAGVVVTVQLLVLSATPPAGPLTAAGMPRSTAISAPPSVEGDGPGLTVSPATRRPVLIRRDGSRVEMPPAPPDGAAPTGEPPSVIRADGSVAQIFQVTLEDGSFGTREKVTHKNGNMETIETTDWDARGEIVSIGSSITAPIEGFFVTPRPAVGPPVLPVAFQEPTPGSVVLTPDQAAGTEHVQEQFITDSGSGTADPSTPAYLNRWRQSQSIADQRLKAAIGGQAFARWQIEAYLRGKEQRTANGDSSGP